MTAVRIIRVAIECNNCKQTFGETDRFPSAMEARSAAYAHGWRFPQRLPRSTKPNAHTDDICPDCYPTWQNK